jgi:DNA-binding IclR family transcriptional regulator
VNRAVGVLDLLVTHPTERFTLSDLVRRTGISLGSAHAVLAVLE